MSSSLLFFRPRRFLACSSPSTGLGSIMLSVSGWGPTQTYIYIYISIQFPNFSIFTKTKCGCAATRNGKMMEGGSDQKQPCIKRCKGLRIASTPWWMMWHYVAAKVKPGSTFFLHNPSTLATLLHQWSRLIQMNEGA